jgi:hypothetical protein
MRKRKRKIGSSEDENEDEKRHWRAARLEWLSHMD